MSGDGRGSWRDMGRALRVPNFRRYAIGQGLSHTGQWFQTTAELWLILLLTGSGTALGLHAVLRFGPTLLFGTYGGLLSDRVDRHRLLIVTQSLHALAVTALVVVVTWSSPDLTVVYAIVFAQGLVNMIDNPLRRTFLRDLVGNAELSNAVSLHAMIGTTTRAAGPALAGLVIAALSVEWCFVLNAVSYGAVLFALATIDRTRLRPFTPVGRGRGQIREGLRYSWNDHRIRGTLVLTMIVSIFAWNWTVVLPVYSTKVFDGDAAQYGALVALMSLGSFVGALRTARLATVGRRQLLSSGAALTVSLWMTALAPHLAVAAAGLVLLGASGTSFTVAAQARLQLNVAEAMSGRVMALYSVGFVGSKPLGGMIGGWITDLAGARTAFAFGGGVVGVAVLAIAARARRQRVRARSGPIVPRPGQGLSWDGTGRAPSPRRCHRT